MRETRASLNAAGNRPPVEDLSGFRWNTGATLRLLDTDEACPVLFRDIGPAALALFLRGKLTRLAGPLSPIVYMRTAEHKEPYTDFERTGRLVILRPLMLGPWHSGISHIYVAKARPGVDFATVGFIPGDIQLSEATRRVEGAANTRELREALGCSTYDKAVVESLIHLDRLGEEFARSERLVEPLRQKLQSADRSVRESASAEMARRGLTESDLCTAWHHIPRDRRNWIEEALRGVAPSE